MSKRNRIIISIVGIFIVLLALIGITYGYFLTRIVGNTNTNSISITTANLRLVYRDGTPLILTKENIQPIKYVDGIDDVSNDNIDEPIGTKTFTVTNEGNGVVNYDVYLENIINDFSSPEDVDLVITCSSNKGTTCNGYNSDYPTINSKLISNTITVDEIHTYTLSVYYYDTNTDQSEDMGKTLQGKVQIYDPNDIVAISGTVSNHTSSYSIELLQLNNDGDVVNTKTSQINSNTYTIPGITPGTYTLNVKYVDEDGATQIKNTKTLTITKGTEENVSSDGATIVITDTTSSITTNINVNDLSILDSELVSKQTTPFIAGSLAEQIYLNKALVEKYTKDEDYNFTSQGTQVNSEIKELTTVTGVSNGVDITDSGLFTAPDDYGTSYFFRGTVRNNYVDFAGFTWRIVRINGDGSVRLILDGTLDKTCVEYDTDGTTCKTYAGSTVAFNSSNNDNAYVGYTYGTAGSSNYDDTHKYTGDKTNTSDKTGQSTIKQAIDTFYETYLLPNYNDYISDTLFCGDKSLASSSIGTSNSALGYGNNITYYAASERLYYSGGGTRIEEAHPTLKCVPNNTTLTESQKAYSRYTVNGDEINAIETNDDLIYPIALLSADELVFAGAWGGAVENSKDRYNQQYYLYNSSTLSSYWWTMSPYSFNGSNAFEFGSSVSSYSLNGSDFFVNSTTRGARPVINLDAEKVIYDEGNGTVSSPYKVTLAST